MGLAALLGGAAPMALGAGFGQAVDIWSGREAAKDQRAWSADMSNTAYQRAVADMRAAGLNPMLAYQQGGATTPSTSAAETGSFSSSLASASQARRVHQEIKLLDEQVKNVQADTYKKSQEADIATFEARLRSWTQKALMDNWEDFQKGAIAPYVLQSAGVASAKAEESMWKDLGEGGKAAQFILPLLKMLIPGQKYHYLSKP